MGSLEPGNGSRPLEDIRVDLSYLMGVLEREGMREGQLRADMYPRGFRKKTITARYVYGLLARRADKLGREAVRRIRENFDSYVREAGGIPPEVREVLDIPQPGYKPFAEPEVFDTAPQKNGAGNFEFSPLSIYTREEIKRIAGLDKSDVEAIKWRIKRERIPGYQIADIFVKSRELRPLWRLGYTGFLPDIIPEVEASQKEFKALKVSGKIKT